jgi:hypothetical protein
MPPIAHRARLATATNTRVFAADLLQMQPAATIGSSIDCRRGRQEASPFALVFRSIKMFQVPLKSSCLAHGSVLRSARGQALVPGIHGKGKPRTAVRRWPGQARP